MVYTERFEAAPTLKALAGVRCAGCTVRSPTLSRPTVPTASRIVDVGSLMPQQLDAISVCSLTGMSA